MNIIEFKEWWHNRPEIRNRTPEKQKAWQDFIVSEFGGMPREVMVTHIPPEKRELFMATYLLIYDNFGG